MSTAGKVLSVVCLLMVVACVYLMAQVSQLNRNWGKAIESVEAQVETAAKDLEQTKVRSYATAQQVNKARVVTDHQIVAVRQDLEDLRGLLSKAQETLLRVELQLEAEQNTIKLAQFAKERRDREHVQLEQDQENVIAEVQQLAARNDELLSRLTELREEFQMLLAENQALLRRNQGRESESSQEDDADATAMLLR